MGTATENKKKLLGTECWYNSDEFILLPRRLLLDSLSRFCLGNNGTISMQNIVFYVFYNT